MEKERRTKALVIVVLLVVVAGLTVAFAALSTTLNINGTAYLDAAKWGIRFENLSEPVKVGTATTTGTAKIEETKAAEITDMNVSLSIPGDKIVYTVDLVNKGTINAKIDNIEKTVLTSEQQRYLTFKVADPNGYEIKQGDILEKGETKKITITIEFKKDLTKEDLPKQTSTISLSYKLNFVQTDEKVTSGSQGGNEKTYSVGDEFCLENECFYVIKDNGTTVDALAKQNVNTKTNKQDKNANTLAFAKRTNGNYGYWTDSSGKLLSKYGTSYPANVYDNNSNLYTPTQNYKTYLKNELGKASVDARLITYEELINLGCKRYTCKNAPSWVYSTNYWTASPDDNSYVWNVNSTGSFDSYRFDYSDNFGLRPVITISKSDI
ncbi:MAG: hypothetical protein ACLUD7_05210 [Lachnospiraceae bacterium]